MMEKSGDVGEFLSYGGILACRCGCLDEALGNVIVDIFGILS